MQTIVRLALLLAIAASPHQRLFPARTGMTWTYSATVRWTEEQTNRVQEKTMPWTSRIVDAQMKGERLVLIIEGYPADLCWYQPNQPLQYTVVVEDEKTIRIGGGMELSRARDAAHEALEGKFDGDTVLRYPVKKGDCIRDPDVNAREDSLYAWCVEGAGGFAAQRVDRHVPQQSESRDHRSRAGNRHQPIRL